MSWLVPLSPFSRSGVGFSRRIASCASSRSKAVLAASMGEALMRGAVGEHVVEDDVAQSPAAQTQASACESGVKPSATSSCSAGIWDWCFSRR